MAMIYKDIFSGQRFGSWTALARDRNFKGKHPRVIVRCDCGVMSSVRALKLRTGKTTSCGCDRVAVTRLTPNKHDLGNVWKGMIHRCRFVRAKNARYAGRGISVCARWRDSFESFVADMGPRPSKRHSLDRIDNDGDYEPGNCRWATTGEQNRNRYNNRMLKHRGASMCLNDWATKMGIKRTTLRARLDKGWSVARAIDTPVRPKRQPRPNRDEQSTDPQRTQEDQ